MKKGMKIALVTFSAVVAITALHFHENVALDEFWTESADQKKFRVGFLPVT